MSLIAIIELGCLVNRSRDVQEMGDAGSREAEKGWCFRVVLEFENVILFRALSPSPMK